jgi:hypothetical protein
MATVAQVQRRLRQRSAAASIAVGGLLYAGVFVFLLMIGGVSKASALTVALLAGLLGALVMALRSGVSLATAAQWIERAQPDLDNLIVTAAEIQTRPRPLRAEIRDEILRQASDRAAAVDVRKIVPLVHSCVSAGLVIAGAVFVGQLDSTSYSLRPRSPLAAVVAGAGPGSFEVRLTPPSYTRRKVEVLTDPLQVSVIAGTRIQIPAAGRDWIATESAAVELRTGTDASPKFLSVIVTPDQPPNIRVVAPGKDAAYATPTGALDVTIQTTDDIGLASLSLRFTKASGGGENVAFTEGELPLRIERRGEQHWNARAELVLQSLGLADGDVLVYCAIARDTNPQGSPVQSEQYLIEIGKNAEIADAGFALPTEERKYAISQQMVIFKTERLIAERLKHPADWLEQTRMIAMEQRMVRAEVVFLGGGEVEDEVEEAAKSDELIEGRLQNAGRAEMLRAINAMSRAEAQLNDGRAQEALVFEREALASLERALDRRRYFLRTLPDRSRIDTGRRLTGERRDARSWDRAAAAAAAPASLDTQRQLMRTLAEGAQITASLAARVAALDPESSSLQKAAVALASATTDAAREDARQQAMGAIAAHALGAVPSTSSIDVRSSPLSGRQATVLSGSRPRP